MLILRALELIYERESSIPVSKVAFSGCHELQRFSMDISVLT